MGTLVENFDDLPDPDTLPGSNWDSPERDALVRRYGAARRALMAFDLEPEEELSRETVSRARELKGALAEVVGSFAADLDDVSTSRRQEAIQLFGRRFSPICDGVAADVRPFVRGDTVDFVAELRAVSESNERVAEAEARLEALEEKAKAIIERVGVGRLAAHYETEAAHQAAGAWRWLIGVGVCVVFLGSVVGWILVDMQRAGSTLSWETAGVMLLSKALVLGVLSYVVTFCSRNYRAHQHLHAVYRQRMAALDTYSTMALALRDDPEDRKLVLTELARAVFTPAETGLTGSTGDRTIIENSIPLVSAMRP